MPVRGVRKYRNGAAAIHIATSARAHGMMASLIRFADLDASDADGNTALHMAALAGDHRSLKMLIEGGANVDKRNDDGYTALNLASNARSVQVLTGVHDLEHEENEQIRRAIDGITTTSESRRYESAASLADLDDYFEEGDFEFNQTEFFTGERSIDSIPTASENHRYESDASLVWPEDF